MGCRCIGGRSVSVSLVSPSHPQGCGSRGAAVVLLPWAGSFWSLKSFSFWKLIYFSWMMPPEGHPFPRTQAPESRIYFALSPASITTFAGAKPEQAACLLLYLYLHFSIGSKLYPQLTQRVSPRAKPAFGFPKPFDPHRGHPTPRVTLTRIWGEGLDTGVWTLLQQTLWPVIPPASRGWDASTFLQGERAGKGVEKEIVNRVCLNAVTSPLPSLLSAFLWSLPDHVQFAQHLWCSPSQQCWAKLEFMVSELVEERESQY